MAACPGHQSRLLFPPKSATGGDQGASDALYGGADPMTAEDIAATVLRIATLPPHLNINRLELMPVNQSFAGFQVARAPAG